MRVGVWLSAAAVVLLAVASAQRTAKVDGASRVGRRLPSPTAPDENSVANPNQSEVQPTFKPRGSRRREEPLERDVIRTRTRSKPTEEISETPPPQGNNERFDSRRTSSRTRSRPIENEIKTEPTVSRENVVRSRTRQVSRRPAQTTQIPLDISSPAVDQSKIEIINSNLNDISKIVPKDENIITTQFRRRSSIAPVIINTPTTESINSKRSRGRINTRSNIRTPDLANSGTTNSISVSDKEPTTVRTGDIKNPRKLRYRTRQSETDTNLTGEGLSVSNEIVKSSQNRKRTSQQETETFAPIIERLVSQSTEANKLKTTTLKVTKVIRRPIGRGKVSKSSVSKTQATEEISDDDNYPPSFKALIQAKNASTQASSPIRESLSVKASQKVYKTYNSSVQSTQTGPAENKYSRLRKQKSEEEKHENKTVDKVNETTSSPDTSTPRNSEYRPRGTYSTRNKKSTVLIPSTTTSPFVNEASSKTYKYNRKFKVSTTESSTSDNVDKNKQSEDNVIIKHFVRPPIYSRKMSTKNTITNETSVVTNNVINSTQSKITLPRTSYYSRLRTNLKNNETSTTKATVKTNEQAQKKIENSVDMPLIFTLLKNPDEAVSSKSFLINVNSKESQEKIININEASDMTGDSENIAVVAISPTMSSRIDIDKYKYHANYKDQNPTAVESKERASSTLTPPVRNLQTRKYGRKRTKSRNINEDNNNLSSPNPRERNIRKFSDVYSKKTEDSSNGIAPESEKPKSRFSSKYRASNVDKPFYKPTVPTITSSTAWLKFFVTDNLLTKSVEEPKWFLKENVDVTTESKSRQYEKASNIHEPSIELVEGEEIQLGPDLNAISFTQTRRTLSSADLRLSESLMKQSHVMNVEASQHSPSVTVSIFDALAEILTSTPRTGLSSTTEVTKKPLVNTDVTQILNGVSNINVNSAQGIKNQENFTPIASDVSTITKSVQNIVQTTPNVINSTVGADDTSTLNTQDVNITPTNTPRTPIPTPTTPISARRPFAIKLLYSDTESSTDQPVTAFESTSNQPTTDSTMVYNTVSDLLLSNNNLLSSELTSMLSNNIKTIIRNMDADSRSKISGDMAKLLNTLIPRALDGLATALDNSDIIPNTTPYSLEDIKDTENIDINKDSVNINFLENVVNENSVNSTVKNGRALVFPTDISTQAVNSSEITSRVTQSSQPTSSSQTTLADVIITTFSPQFSSVSSKSADATTSTQAITSSAFVDAGTTNTAIDTENRLGMDVFIDSTNNISPLPFLTNYEIDDFTTQESDSTRNSGKLVKSSVGSLLDDINIQDPSQLSRVQLWVLSKKARVLKMIEDLIRQHNDELATVPTLTNIVNPSDKVNLSERLTNIMNTIISTTETTSINNDNPISLMTSTPMSPMSTTPMSPITTPTSQVIISSSPMTTSMSFMIAPTSSEIAPTSDVIFSTMESLSVETTTSNNDVSSSIEQTTTFTDDSQTIVSSRFGSSIEETSETSGTSAAIMTIPVDDTNSTQSLTTITSSRIEPETEVPSESGETVTVTTSAIEFTNAVNMNAEVTTIEQENSNRLLDEPSTTTTVAEISQTTTQTNTDTTTVSVDFGTTTQLNLDTITQNDSDATIPINTDTATTVSGVNQPTTPLSILRVATPTIPKKDYVIFGILPNNTVVRKDPNDDVLDTLTEASPYIVYGVLPNNTIIRKFPNGTRVPRVMQKIDVLPISPWSLRNPYSPIHNNPAIVRPQPNPIRVSTNTVTFTDTSNNGKENSLTINTVNNLQLMISSSALNIKSSSLGITTATNKPHAEKSTASHVLSLRTTTILPSIDEILLNSISSAAKQEMVISSMTSSTREPRILTLDIDPETKQIRTEKPDDGEGNAIFKFIPIDEVTVSSQNSNVLKLASTRTPATTNTEKTEVQIVTATSVTESNTPTQQIQTQRSIDESTSNLQTTVGSTLDTNLESTTISMPVATTEIMTTLPTVATSTPTTTTLATTSTVPSTTSVTTTITTQAPTTTTIATTTTTTAVPMTTTSSTTTTDASTSTTTIPAPTTMIPVTPSTLLSTTSSLFTTSTPITTAAQTTTISIEEDLKKYQEDLQLLQTLLQATGRDPKNLNLQNNINSLLFSQTTTTSSPITKVPVTSQSIDQAQLLQALLSTAGRKTNTLSIPNIGSRINDVQTTTFRSIEDDIKQFEEDTKLLKALLQATGQNPSKLNIPTLDNIRTTTRDTPTTTTPTTTTIPTTTFKQTTTQTIAEDIKQLQEDTKLLQALLKATGQKTGNLNLPIVSGVTSNIRIASNPQTTSIMSNPTTPIEIRPVYTTTQVPVLKTFAPRTVSPTLQPAVATVTEDVGISTTFAPFSGGMTTTFRNFAFTTVPNARQAPQSRFTVTTDIPSTSTFSVQEDLAFLQNLKNVLNTNPQNQDPEAALANRVIALAVEKSLKEIQSGTESDSVRTGKNIANSANNIVTTTTTTRPTTTTTTSTTTTTPRPTTTVRPITTTLQNGPSIEDDIRQFQEDTKLLQALIKATGQDPSQFNIPTLPNIQTDLNVSPNLQKTVDEDLNLLSNLLASPSPLNEPFDPLTQKPNANVVTKPTDKLPFGAKLAVTDDFKNVQDDGKLLQTLIQLQGKQETTTQKSKLITGQTSDEALQKLIQQTKPTGMISEATAAPISLSTEYGKSNDALLAALLKEQGFGPTTASSLDEQLRLAALLNQVVVTPKARRTTTPPPPPPSPPAPRRPVLDGLAWLWQQWRETAPGPGTTRPNRKPAPSSRPPAPSPTASSGRVNWFGSGPFVGNADDRPGVNRIPLEPPRAVATEQAPARGQLVSAAINVTRAFSQFLGAAIQGAAQTVQSVIRAGQKAATDVYTNGSGGSG